MADVQRLQAKQGLLELLKSHFSSTPIDKQDDALTHSEREFLNVLLEKGTTETIRSTSELLSDEQIFPRETTTPIEETRKRSVEDKILNRRNSILQQQLFKLHEEQNIQPKLVLQKLQHQNSLLRTTSPKWNPFEDVSSWLDRAEGVEVEYEHATETNNNNPSDPTTLIAPNFRILGTSANDVSCQPHVLSPPLMESLLEFMEPSQNVWLKYSLARDGPGLLQLLKRVRLSSPVLLGLETTDGHVFGCCTASWRLSEGWFGATESSFLWKLRRPRNHELPLADQILSESEIQVFHARSSATHLQYCSRDGLRMGVGEIQPPPDGPTQHLGHALTLDAHLQNGTTSSSETYGNPCLLDEHWRGGHFEVSNLEVWTLTASESVAEAETNELSSFFLERRGGERLDLVNVLVGGPI